MSEKREMTAVEFLKEMKRMCKSCPGCDGCEMEKARRETCSHSCFVLLKEYPEQAVAGVQKWAEEQPVKTRAQDFFEKYPKAHKTQDGIPTFCVEALGYARPAFVCGYICTECWNRPLEVKP